MLRPHPFGLRCPDYFLEAESASCSYVTYSKLQLGMTNLILQDCLRTEDRRLNSGAKLSLATSRIVGKAVRVGSHGMEREIAEIEKLLHP